MTITSPFNSPPSSRSSTSPSPSPSTSTSPGISVDANAPDPTASLRRVLIVDAAGAAGSGLMLLVAAGPLTRLADSSAVEVVQLVGLGLFVLAVDLVLLARSRRSTLLRFTPFSVAGDVVWMAASFVVAAAVEMNAGARVVVVVQGLIVGGVALAKTIARRRAVRAPR